MADEKLLKEYQEFCISVAQKFKNSEKEILVWGLGLVGEAGDAAGCIKKTYAHDNDQKAGIKENLGDTLWYIAMICNFYGWDLKDVLKENIDKLSKRYVKGHFTTEDAGRKNTRIDWNEK